MSYQMIVNHSYVRAIMSIFTFLELIFLPIQLIDYLWQYWGGLINLWPFIWIIGLPILILWILVIISNIGREKNINLITLEPCEPSIHYGKTSDGKLVLRIKVNNKAHRIIKPTEIYLKSYIDYKDVTTFKWQSIKKKNDENDKIDIKVSGMEKFQDDGYIDLEFWPSHYLIDTMQECYLEGMITFSDGRKKLHKLIKIRGNARIAGENKDLEKDLKFDLIAIREKFKRK